MACRVERATCYLPATLAGVLIATAPLHAQPPGAVRPRSERVSATPLEATAGSELEEYIRALQLTGAIAERSVTLRGYTPHVLNLLGTTERHPWNRFAFTPTTSDASRRWRARVDALPLRAWSVFNQAFPFDYGDGAVWSGRGLTSVVTGGVSAQVGPITLVVQPVAFRAENRPFALAPVTEVGATPYADGSLPLAIDTPQRFGDAPYARIDAGQSTLRMDIGPIAAGVSTAAPTWGPGAVHALLMGQNAPGFRHIFLGTSGMRSVGIGRLNVNLILGRPVDSPYAPPRSASRYLAGGVAAFSPSWVPGLEVGGGRVFHRLTPTGGVSLGQLFSVFENFFQSAAAMSQKNLPTDANYTPDNQIASAFASWSHPRSGLRIYGELLKNDNNLDVRELATEPDHDAAILLGVEQAFARARDGSAFTILRAETVNARITHLDRVRRAGDAVRALDPRAGAHQPRAATRLDRRTRRRRAASRARSIHPGADESPWSATGSCDVPLRPRGRARTRSTCSSRPPSKPSGFSTVSTSSDASGSSAS